ncbi:PREDICTED: leucine-rich PPR motif-containing protein, mitochondrial [Rhagoletis zephyria]|uniref:leucine-rich PPR motif-containing protein, mitochondrial n=1 Tax=Rhagoletis zephyria TaxID=28612 RepID=UPI000811878C|nr:PREDICTED: leucine-rich PPR motif-containing protein, mitochondrial [Rhagoletis zephyria]
MSARLWQTTWKWQRLSRIALRVNYQPNAAVVGYATEAVRKSLQQSVRNYTNGSPNKWNNLQSSYDTTAKEASATRTTRTPVLTVLLEKLISQHQASGQVVFELCDKVITQLESNPNAYNQLLSSEQAHFLLRACGTRMPARPSATRLELFQRLWSYLAQHAQLNASNYLTWLHVLQHNRAPLADFRLFLQEFNKLNNSNELALPDVYAELLLTACSTGDIKQATEVLAEMREHEFPLMERHFNALLLGHARNRDLAGCRTVLDNMAAAGVLPSTETQSLLVCAYVENEAPAKAAEVLDQFHGKFDAVQVVRMLRSLLYVESQPDEELIKKLVRELPKDFAEGTEVALPMRHLCIELLHHSHLTSVNHIISSLPTPRFNENQNIDTFGVFLLQELFRAKCTATEIIEVAKLLQDSGKNTRSLHITTEIALRRNAETALPYLESLAQQEPLRPHYFWPLLLHNHRQSGEAGVLSALKQMKALNVACDRETIALYVLPHLPVTLQRPEQAIKALDDIGIKPSSALLEIIMYLLLRQRFDAAHDLLELYPTKMPVEQLVPTLANAAVNVRATKRYQQFVKLLAALSKKSENRKVDWVGQLLLGMVHGQMRLRSDLRAVYRFVDEMVKFALVISPAAANALVAALEEQVKNNANLSGIKEALRKITDNNVVLPQSTAAGAIGPSNSFVKHPRDMTLEELEYHLVELEAKGMNTRGVLRRLLQLCVRDGRLERALEIKAKCDELKVQVSAGMLASTLELYIKLKDLPNAEKSLQRLQQQFSDFTVDEHKFIDYAALLVHNNRLDAAKQLLQERAKTQRIQGGDYVIKNVWNFLTNIAQLAAKMPTLEPERNLTREHFHFLQKLRYCNAHNSVLGPIVRERLLRGDIKAAVVDFIKLAEQYKHTPLQFELLSLLVRLSNGHEPDVTQFGGVSGDEAQQLLGEVTNTISKVHGVLNMNSGLLLAFAESGTDSQLRRLLINPEFRINEELLMKNCDYLGEEGAVNTLLRLARGARGFGRIIDEQNIHNMLLTHFAKANNYEAALDLYERLEADDELKISQEFLRNLVQLLRVNNVEIPSRVALRAQIM